MNDRTLRALPHRRYRERRSSSLATTAATTSTLQQQRRQQRPERLTAAPGHAFSTGFFQIADLTVEAFTLGSPTAIDVVDDQSGEPQFWLTGGAGGFRDGASQDIDPVAGRARLLEADELIGHRDDLVYFDESLRPALRRLRANPDPRRSAPAR